MLRKIAVALMSVIAAAVVLALIINFGWQFWNSRLPQTTSQSKPGTLLSVETTSDIPQFHLVQFIKPELVAASYSTSEKLTLGQIYGKILTDWGVFGNNALTGINTMSPNNIAPFDSTSPGFTAKKIVLKLTDKPQPFHQTIDKRSSIVASVGDSFDPASQTLTVLINFSPDYLQGNDQHLLVLSDRADVLFLSRLYQLLHPNASDKQAESAAGELSLKLNGQHLLLVTKDNE